MVSYRDGNMNSVQKARIVYGGQTRNKENKVKLHKCPNLFYVFPKQPSPPPLLLLLLYTPVSVLPEPKTSHSSRYGFSFPKPWFFFIRIPGTTSRIEPIISILGSVQNWDDWFGWIEVDWCFFDLVLVWFGLGWVN